MTVRLAAVISLVVSSVSAQQLWYADDFEASPLERHWETATTGWTTERGVVRIQTRAYDELLSSPWEIAAEGTYVIELRLRGERSGVFFCLDRRDSKALSHMVRFDGESLLAGYFDGVGVFQATGTMELKQSPKEWTDLSVAVDPGLGQYRLKVNGKSVGVPQKLVYGSGSIGLQASDGTSEFDFIRVTGPPGANAVSWPALGQVPTFRHVEWVRWANEGVELYDPERKALLSLDGDGRLLALTKCDAPERLRSVDSQGNRYQIQGQTLLVFQAATGRRDSIAGFFLEPWSLATGFVGDVYVADVGRRSITRVSADGKIIAEFRARGIGTLKAPRGVAVNESGTMVIADYDRLVFTDTLLAEWTSDVGARTVSSVVICWPRRDTSQGTVRYRVDGGVWQSLGAAVSEDGRFFEASLEHLDPLARYSYTVSPAIRTIPERASVSTIQRFSTGPPDPGQMVFTRLPVLCMVYRTMSVRDRYPADRFAYVPDGRSLSEEEIDQLRSAVRFNREFFFRNSSCRLVLDIDTHVVDDTLWLGEIGETDPYWLSPNDRVKKDFEAAARSIGRQPGEYSALIVLYAWLNYPPRSASDSAAQRDSVRFRQAYGGGTYGVPAPWAYGATLGYTANPFTGRFSRQDWLITHEFHHQLDALMEESGYAEYFHADMPWLMSGQFGEDFDFNAEIIRRAPLERWLTLAYGTLQSTADRDRDGVPDDDPSLPLDERRLKGSPRLSDTDHDSSTDLEELMAGISRGTGLASRDTDGDGVIDGNDSEPLVPFSPERKRTSGKPRWDFGRIRTESYEARFSLEWNEESLLLFCESTAPVNLLFQIDARDDGWFHGFDNVQIRLHALGDSLQVVDYYLRDCSSQVAPPKDRRDILRHEDLKTSLIVDHESGSRQIVVTVPRIDTYGLTLTSGKRLAVRIGTQTAEDRWVWDELFERNVMMSLSLQ